MRRTLLLVPLLLVACGGAVVPNDTATTATVAVQPEAATTAVVEQPATETVAVQSTATTASVAAPAEGVTTATVAVRDSAYAALGQSTTPEGYYVLGEADAPVVMTHYSDFL